MAIAIVSAGRIRVARNTIPFFPGWVKDLVTVEGIFVNYAVTLSYHLTYGIGPNPPILRADER
jgi:hypothetical protein